MRKRSLRRLGERGAALIEFALALPILLGFIIGAVQLGLLFFAHADLRNAVAAGARHASIYPRPGDDAVIATINANLSSLEADLVDGPTIVRATDANGRTYADIEMSYSVPLDFIVYRTPPVTLTETRRVFTQPEAS